jgi:hypothetical protein
VKRFTAHGLLDCHAICDQRDAAVARAERAEAELLIAQRLLIDSEDAGTVAENLRAELAAERARLDWLEDHGWITGEPCGRAAIDAAMKEGAK